MFKCQHEPTCTAKEKEVFDATFDCNCTVDKNGSVLDADPHPAIDKESVSCSECGAKAVWEG